MASAGITPDNSVTYTSAEIQAALSRATGKRVTIGCKSGQLKEVWYHFNVRGSVQTGEFVATDPGKFFLLPWLQTRGDEVLLALLVLLDDLGSIIES